MFLLKKLVSAFLMPVPLTFTVAIAGLAVRRFTKRKRLGTGLVVGAFVLLALLSHDLVAEALLAPLEMRYAPVLVPGRPPSAADETARTARWVVVLGNSHTSRVELPPTVQLNQTAASRLVEGIRLQRILPDSKLVLSGYGRAESTSHAEVQARAAEALGVPRDRMVIEPRPRDTEEEAQLVRALVGRDRIILVTSASHMPRAAALFRKHGVDIVPSPADYMVRNSTGLEMDDFVPSAGTLRKSHHAFHEYLGLLWTKLRGG